MHTQNLKLIDLSNTLRKLWFEHVMWTRSFIVSNAGNLKELTYVTNRLLKNPYDFAEVFKNFYSNEQTEQFKKLFTEHLSIAGDLVNAAKSGNMVLAGTLRDKWYKNADEIVKFLASINPHWNEADWKAMMHTHLKLTEDEAVQILTGKYEQSIEQFDKISEQAMEMADMMTKGLIRQFYLK